MLAKTFSAIHSGIEGAVVEIEAAKQQSLPQIHITGLPGDVVKESRERIRACLVNLGFTVPSARIIVHLSPAHSRKQGSQLDLAIAVSVLIAEGMLMGVEVSEKAFLGEVSLDGRIRRIGGAVALIQALVKCPVVKTILLPRENAPEAALIASPKIRMVDSFSQLLSFLRGKSELPGVEKGSLPPMSLWEGISIDDVVGQELAKRALQIAIAGRHHLLLVGPPGVGKSMLAGCVPGLLPPLERSELVEVSKNYSHTHSLGSLVRIRPFRSPHHTISSAALLGGGSGVVIPGEVTLAHSGVLFLDEFPEFRRDGIEGLREPLQTGIIHLHRTGHVLSLPARFILIAAMNPCPCGYQLSPNKQCSCSSDRVVHYRKRISGAIIDRMDLCVVMASPRPQEGRRNSLTHAEVQKSIESALRVQRQRYFNQGDWVQNGDANVDMKLKSFELGGRETEWFHQLCEREGLSFRSLHKVMRVARTIADLAGCEAIQREHLQETWGLRCPDSYRHPSAT